jgi:hypothetical protein
MLISSRRPVLEEPVRPTQTNRAHQPPGPGQVPIQIRLPATGDAAPPAQPGQAPVPLARTAPRLFSGGPIALPPGYDLPPGWAVIPANHVQILPPQHGENIQTAPNVPVAGASLAPSSINASPNSLPGGPQIVPSGDQALARSSNDESSSTEHTRSASPNGPRPEASSTTANLPPTAVVDLPLPQNTSAASSNTPNFTQLRATGRLWASQSPHPAFPLTVPLFAMPFNAPGQPRTAAFDAGRADGRVAASLQNQPTLGGLPTMPERRETQEQFHILRQLGENLRSAQELFARLSNLSSLGHPPPSTPHQSPSPSPPLNDSNATASVPRSTTRTDSDVSSSSSSLSSDLQRHRSLSPNEHVNEKDPNIHRLSSDDEISPNELANIRAPWNEQALDDELPVNNMIPSGEASPPRLRSGSQSPRHSLKRRGSLLRHEITDEIVTNVAVERSTLDKGKGKGVYIEDGSEGE